MAIAKETRDKLAKLAQRSAMRRKRARAEPHPLRAPKRKKGVHPGRKGGGYERAIARKFAAWTGSRVTRTPQSGGWHAATEFDVTGDLVFTHKSCKKLCIECKDREKWLMTDLITGKRAQGSRSIETWWEQTVKAAGSTKQPLLVFTRNHQPDYLMIRVNDISKFEPTGWWRFVPHFRVENDNGERIVMQLDDFMRYVKPPKKSPGRKTWERGVLPWQK